MPDRTREELARIVAIRADASVDPGIAELAARLVLSYGDAAKAVLAYGSCLRGVSLDDSLADLYVLVTGYRQAHGRMLPAIANRLLPPNVYYLEHPFEGRILRAKYAVVSLEQFEQKVSGAISNPYFWARFAQPCALVHAADPHTRQRVSHALAAAVYTAYANALALAPEGSDWRRLWTLLFEATYRTELRPESSERAAAIVDDGADHFEHISSLLAGIEEGPAPVSANWALRRLAGKALSVLRLIKSGFTFRGGADYLAWKISRHSGVSIEVTPWQRRHPILGALAMAPKLYRKGGFR